MRENGRVLVSMRLLPSGTERATTDRCLERVRCYCQPLHLVPGGGTLQPSGIRPVTKSATAVVEENLSKPAPVQFSEISRKPNPEVRI